MTSWWSQDRFEVGTLEVDDNFYRSIAARRLPNGQWEYAIVHWRYGTATLMVILRDGLVQEESHG